MTKNVTFLISLLCLILGAGAAWAEDLQISDFSYSGAFRLPAPFNWGARGMTYRPNGDGGKGSLIVIGHDQVLGEWGELGIPSPATGRFGSLPTAPLIGAMVEFDGSLIEAEVDAAESRAGDVACLPPRGSQTREVCYWNAEWWYNVAATDYRAVGMSDVDGSNPRGLWHVGPRGDAVFHGSRHGSYMFAVPSWYADSSLNGHSIMVGMAREAGCCGSSQGPTLFAFRPWEVDDPAPRADLDAIALVYYPSIYPGCAGPNVGDPDNCSYPGYRACDRWVGGAFVESGFRSAVVVSGIKAYGENNYGGGDANSCDDSQGYHCEPLNLELIFYSTDDLADAAAGRMDPAEVIPYEIWTPDEIRDSRCPQVGGIAMDRDNGRFFMIEKGFGQNNSAVVHVYSLEPAQGVDRPPAGDGGTGSDPDQSGCDCVVATPRRTGRASLIARLLGLGAP
jgi:hypothetical protein